MLDQSGATYLIAALLLSLPILIGLALWIEDMRRQSLRRRRDELTALAERLDREATWWAGLGLKAAAESLNAAAVKLRRQAVRIERRLRNE